jgi:actin-related protein
LPFAPRVLTLPRCRYAPFIGGAILAKTVFPQNQHITKHDYHEFGPSVVSRRAT